MSMYRAMQNADTPDLPFAQSVMELATLTRPSSKYEGEPISTLYHKVQKTRSVDIVQLEKQRNTGLLALAGVLLLA